MTGFTQRAYRHVGRILLAGALLASAASSMAQAASPTGLWQTIDDKTGQITDTPTKDFIKQQLVAFAKFITAHGGKS